MNVLLDDLRIKREHDNQLAGAKSHKLAMTMHTAQSAIATLFEMSNDAEYRDLMVDDAGSVSELALALNLIWSRVKARNAA